MRRIQVGLIGLTVIIMLLSIGNAIVSRLHADPSKSGPSNPVKSMEKSPDPAAKLGIAPANSPENAVLAPQPAVNQPNPTGLPLTNNPQPAASHP